MKVYKAGSELERILMNQGFIETSSSDDLNHDRRSFKLIEKGRKFIYIAGNNIEIRSTRFLHDSRTIINEHELKLLILFFKLKTSDLDELIYNDLYNINEAAERLSILQAESERLKEINRGKGRRKILERIICTFNAIPRN
jgi:hypothetical protein